MPKYSFIVPIYNVELYVEKCLTSLLNQTYENFEIIAVNDGSEDDSYKILKGMSKNNDKIKILNQKNKGLSEARNVGVKKASGEYLIFVDSDDYVKSNLLEQIDKNIGNHDILRFQILIDNLGKITEYSEKGFENFNGVEALKKILTYHFVEPAWCYVFEREFYIKNKFQFMKNKYHEDFGLIPYIIYSAKSVSSISYAGYYYVQRNNSIMNLQSKDKLEKKAYDMLEQYLYIKKKIKDKNVEYLLSYMANCSILKCNTLKGISKKEYIKNLKKNKVVDDVLSNNLIRKIKKIIMKISLRFYLWLVRK